jgi:hypothetical protein
MATRSYKTQTPGAPADPATNPDATQIAGMGADDVMIDVSGRDVPMNDIVRSAYETSAYSAEAWNALDGHERDELIAAKRKELAQQFRDLGDEALPDQAEVQRRAAAAVEQRRRARKAIEQGAAPEEVLPHSSELDPDQIAAPVLCRDGWLVPTPKDPLPQKYR